ncbi:MAG: hypothetical protein J1F09_03710 [Oscillospiraceae bacterium]|nr:hypothetical protein [Oscillospiraceae bacterium]
MAYPAYQIDNTNLAYDLSRFDTTERDRREKQRKEEEQAQKIQMAPAVSVSKSGSKAKIVLAVTMVFIAFFFVNYYNTKKDDVSRMVTQQEALLAAAKDDNALLQSKLDSKANIGYIEEYATEKLGMTKVTSSQKKYISVNTESLIEVENDDSAGFLGAVKRWFSSVLEYIGI